MGNTNANVGGKARTDVGIAIMAAVIAGPVAGFGYFYRNEIRSKFDQAVIETKMSFDKLERNIRCTQTGCR